jgi:AcrR family transcriptional regulator
MTAEERREQLLDVTKAIVAERGFHAVSIEAVAREAGITRPIVYGHFRDLSGLLEALIDRESARALAQLNEVLVEDLAHGGDPVEQLLASLRGYLEVVRSDPATWRLVLMPPEGAPEALHDRIAGGRAAIIAQLTGAVSSVPGGRESPDPELTARMLSVFADEAARLQLTDPRRYPVERILDHARWALGRFAPGN